MGFFDILAEVVAVLQREGRVSYRALKVQFSLDDDQLEALKDELIEAKRLAVDERGLGHGPSNAERALHQAYAGCIAEYRGVSAV